MGCTPEQQPCGSYLPQRIVRINHFWIGKYEVTQGQWVAVMSTNPSSFANCGLNCPIDGVSFFDAATFCNRLSSQQGLKPCYYFDVNFINVFDSIVNYPNINVPIFWDTNANGYRLPIESEWEYSARGGSYSAFQTKYSGSNNLDSVAWHDGNSQVTYSPNHSGKGTHPVGLKKANSLGTFDMNGNLHEITYDNNSQWYGYTPDDCNDLHSLNDIIARGGFWGNFITYFQNESPTVSDQGSGSFYSRDDTAGFRLARNAD